MRSLSRFALLLPALYASTARANQYQDNAEAALQTLQTFYDNSTGLWKSFGPSWWQSANALTTLANMAALNSSYAQEVGSYVFPTTFQQAAAQNIKAGHHLKRHVQHERQEPQNGFINGYYDDEGWWAMAWIRVYDVTQNETYLDSAKEIFQDMTTGWGTNCSSEGLWWNKPHTEINPISNSLFMEVAAYLANRATGDDQQTYINWAEKEWAWFQTSGMWKADQNLAIGGIDVQTCQPTGIHGFTYAQGSFAQALTSLAHVTGNQTYLDQAGLIAKAVIANMSVDGVLQEPHINQQSPGQSAPQFKGVFMRGLMRLFQSQPDPAYAQFAESSAQSIWLSDKTNEDLLGSDWRGGANQDTSASPQSSAMDALVAAWSLTNNGTSS